MKIPVRKHIIEIILVGALSISSVAVFPLLSRYRIKFEDSRRTEKNWVIVYDDLNGDGESEEIVFISDTMGFSSLQIRDEEIIHGQWKFSGKFTKGIFYAFGDHDKNGFKEVYLFVTRNDTLYLNVIESFTARTIICHKPVRKLQMIHGVFDITIHPASFTDFDNDGKDEFLFMISSGYTYADRVMYGYFIRKDSLIQTPVCASCLSYPYEIIKTDTNIYICGVVREPGNTGLDYPCTDSLAWVIVWDKNLNYLFNPVKIGEHPAIVYTKSFVHSGEIFFAGLYLYGGLFDTSKLFIVDKYGNIIKQKTLYLTDRTTFVPYDTREILTLIDSRGRLKIFNRDLELVKTLTLRNPYGELYYYSPLKDDITGDGIPDKIYVTKDQNHCVFFDPATLTMVPIDIRIKGNPLFVSKYIHGKRDYLCFYLPGEKLFYRFSVSLLYKIRYLIPLFIFFLFILLFWAVKKTFNYFVNKKVSGQKEITKLQLLNVKNQMDSHFAFNVLDCIGNSFRNNDFETADKLFVNYSRMLQQSVQLSGEIAIPLQQEMEYIENYLVLEKIRSGDRFDFKIRNRVKTNMKVPKFILFTFVENAVKHGVLPLSDRKGEIIIDARHEKNTIIISVQDNGMGFEEKNVRATGTGNGLKIVDRLIDFFRHEYSLSIDYRLRNNIMGTIVNITFNYGS